MAAKLLKNIRIYRECQVRSKESYVIEKTEIYAKNPLRKMISQSQICMLELIIVVIPIKSSA